MVSAGGGVRPPEPRYEICERVYNFGKVVISVHDNTT